MASMIESIEKSSEREQQNDESFASNRDQSLNYDPSSERRHLRQGSASETVVNLPTTLKGDLLKKEPKKLTIAKT